MIYLMRKMSVLSEKCPAEQVAEELIESRDAVDEGAWLCRFADVAEGWAKVAGIRFDKFRGSVAVSDIESVKPPQIATTIRRLRRILEQIARNVLISEERQSWRSRIAECVGELDEYFASVIHRMDLPRRTSAMEQARGDARIGTDSPGNLGPDTAENEGLFLVGPPNEPLSCAIGSAAIRAKAGRGDHRTQRFERPASPDPRFLHPGDSQYWVDGLSWQPSGEQTGELFEISEPDVDWAHSYACIPEPVDQTAGEPTQSQRDGHDKRATADQGSSAITSLEDGKGSASLPREVDVRLDQSSAKPGGAAAPSAATPSGTAAPAEPGKEQGPGGSGTRKAARELEVDSRAREARFTPGGSSQIGQTDWLATQVVKIYRGVLTSIKAGSRSKNS
jgi:hypothetical protein